MILSLFQLTAVRAARVFAWWQRLRLPCKIAAAACLLILGGMGYVGLIVAEHIKENVVQRSAATVALYMDNFVGRHVQELAAQLTLSEADKRALQRLLSPASMHRSIVAFRVWKGDTIIFGNEPNLVGKRFAHTPARERAWQGHVGVEYDQPDGDDDEQVRSLRLPVLEVYAPVREKGTGRIIAVVETYEIAVELQNEVWRNQFAAWTAIAAIALMNVLLLFSMVSTDSIERRSFIDRIDELARLRVESERHRRRISHANLNMSEINEQSLRNVASELRDGTAQYIASALLQLESLRALVSRANAAMPSPVDEDAKDVEAIRRTLDDALRHIRGVAISSLPADIEELSVVETVARAARYHERRMDGLVNLQSRGLPPQLPFPIKACLYRFVLESLDSTFSASTGQPQRVCASCDDEKIVIEIVGGEGRFNGDSPPLTANTPNLESLRNRIEAVGGKFRLTPASGGGLSLVAEVDFSDMELAGA